MVDASPRSLHILRFDGLFGVAAVITSLQQTLVGGALLQAKALASIKALFTYHMSPWSTVTIQIWLFILLYSCTLTQWTYQIYFCKNYSIKTASRLIKKCYHSNDKIYQSKVITYLLGLISSGKTKTANWMWHKICFEWKLQASKLVQAQKCVIHSKVILLYLSQNCIHRWPNI